MRAALRLALLATVTVAATVAAAVVDTEEGIDPDDLAAMLADLEASGGILTRADLKALLPAPATPPSAPKPARNFWGIAVTGRDAAPPRTDLRAERRHGRLSFRVRARRDREGTRMAGWVRGSASGWNAAVGGGALAHGAGLLAAAPGYRPTLAPDASLLPPRSGWRPSTALEPGVAPQGAALGWSNPSGSVGVGAARGRAGDDARHLRAALSLGPARLAAVALRRGGRRGHGVDLVWHRNSWRLVAEVARWHGERGAEAGRAWHLAAQWRSGPWRAELQAAASRAAAGLEGAARPACLPGWRGRGWALRVAGPAMDRISASLVYGRGERREPDAAAGTLGERSQLGLQIHGAPRARTTWDLRLRRTVEARRGWDPLQPWLPAGLVDRRQRTWLTLALRAPVGAGEGRITWRWLEESGRSRSLLTMIWSGRRSWGRWQAGIQMAWGDPLDLVAVSAPVPGLVRLRHWGHWRSGLVAGLGGGHAWRWQCGGELRRPSREAGGGQSVELHVAWGRSL